MNIFVSSLSFKAKKEDLFELFSPFGEVLSARIILNKETRRSRGYGFVEMASREEGQTAITTLNGSEHMGRTINVAEAYDRPAPNVPATPVVEPVVEAVPEPVVEEISEPVVEEPAVEEVTETEAVEEPENEAELDTETDITEE